MSHGDICTRYGGRCCDDVVTFVLGTEAYSATVSVQQSNGVHLRRSDVPHHKSRAVLSHSAVRSTRVLDIHRVL